jgi:hypothetical protein
LVPALGGKENRVKAYVVEVPCPDEPRQLPVEGPLVKVHCDQAAARSECEQLNSEESGPRYEVTEVEVAPDAVQSYAAARAAVEAAECRTAEATFAAFLAGCRALFEAHPDLQSFGWRQYTSWSRCGMFADDHVDCDAPDINGVEGQLVDGWFWWDSESGHWTGQGEPSPQAKLQRAVAVFLLTFHEDDLMDLFEVDAFITVRRDGSIETEDYDDGSLERSALCDDVDEDEEDDDEDSDDEE